MSKLKTGIFLVIEKFLHFCIVPQLRAKLLKLFGAQVGKNVRVYEITLINVNNGFKNLIIEDDVHIGTGCMIDLAGKVILKRGATLSPRVTIITHVNPGFKHNSPLASLYPPSVGDVEIGEYAWVGTNSTIIKGVKIGRCAVIGACSLVNEDIPTNSIAFGVPAKVQREIVLPKDN